MEKGFFLPAMKKRKQGQGQPKHLVICFSPLAWAADPMYYRFESFPISKLTHGGNYLKQTELDDCSDDYPSVTAIWEKPEGVFVWCDNENPCDSRNPRHWGMNFLHIGGGQVYAAGGIINDDIENFFAVATLNKEFRCISLSTPLESSTVECRRSMQINTYTPLMVEIGGLIYVLSAPSDLLSNHTESTGFEVYNPLTDAWTALKTPTFLKARHETVPVAVSRYSYVVIGNKLCVSTKRYSAIFDTETKEWGRCNLFSEYKWPGNPECRLPRRGHSGVPFPFHAKAMYRNNIILGVRFLVGELGLCAFKITDDEEKAIEMPLHFDDMPEGIGCVDIVDLGDDCFALMTEGGSTEYEFLIVTFKVVSKMMKNEEGEGEDEVEGLVCELMDITACDAPCDSGMGWRNPIYWFTM